MKTTSKYNLRTILTKSSALLALILLMPLSSLAVESNKSATSPNTEVSTSFCTNLGNESDKLSSKVTDLSSNLTEKLSHQSDTFATKLSENDQKVAIERVKSDTERNTTFSQLEAKATNDAQKQAVKTFEASVKSAIATRRASYDAAKTTFKSAVQAAINSKQTSVTGQLSTFDTAVKSAISAAKASCASDPTNSKIIHDNYKTAMKTARATFQGDRSSDSTIGTQIRQFVNTRDAAFKAADAAFQAAMTSAKTALITAFTKTT